MDYLQCYQKAGQIASEVRETARSTSYIGKRLLDILWKEKLEHLGDFPPSLSTLA